MGSYEGTAKEIVDKVVAARRMWADQERQRQETAANAVGNLQELADDVNAELKAHKLDTEIKVQATQWKEQSAVDNPMERSLVSTVSLLNQQGHEHKISVGVPIGTDKPVHVAGKPIQPGNTAMGAIISEIVSYLTRKRS
jgi:hypothetical protein